jgi:RNA polymerase primary sigma factor
MRFKDINFTEAFECLTAIEQDVIRDRFGLGENNEPRSLHFIGDKYDITRERVRQIQEKALRKLRDPQQIRTLLKIEDQDVE